jgi:hypothetical protein
MLTGLHVPTGYTEEDRSLSYRGGAPHLAVAAGAEWDADGRHTLTVAKTCAGDSDGDHIRTTASAESRVGHSNSNIIRLKLAQVGSS